MRHEIGVHSIEQYDYKPAEVFVVEHQRVKYACKCCAGHVAVAPKPLQLLDKWLPGPGLLARILRRFPMPMLREWTDITQAAKERFGVSFFKKNPQAFLVDNLKNAVNGKSTPPDWWHDVRRAEARTHAKSQTTNAEMTPNAMLELSDEPRLAYERIAREMFTVFRAGGQSEYGAKVNAEMFAREYSQRGTPDPGLFFFHLLKG
jgi:hypothetical protein